MGPIQVIEWSNPGDEEIIWKYPNETIVWGAQLIVHEYEVAVVMRDGKVYGVFGPGRHTLTTQNLPLLYRLVGGKDSPFKATVVFVSMKEFKGKFGGETQTKELAPLKFFGEYWFRVVPNDPVLFITEVVGGQGLYDSNDVTRFLRGYFNENLIKHLSNYSIVDVFQNIDRVSNEVKIKLMEDFRRIGLELIDVKISGINTTEEWRERLFWLQQTGNAQYVMQLDTLKDVAKELGKSGAASIGTGMVVIPPLLQPPMYPAQYPPQQQTVQPQQQSQTQEVCPYCGKNIPQGAKFCPECGKKINRCPNGHIVPEGAKFCHICGAKLE